MLKLYHQAFICGDCTLVPGSFVGVLTPPSMASVDILGSLLGHGWAWVLWSHREHAFAEVKCGCVKAMCSVLGRFGFFSASCPKSSGHRLGPTSPHPREQQVPGGGRRTNHHCKVCILPGLSRGLLLSRGGGATVFRSSPASKGESDHQAAQSCHCPFNYKVMDSSVLRLSSAPALAGTVMIVKVELMRRAHL